MLSTLEKEMIYLRVPTPPRNGDRLSMNHLPSSYIPIFPSLLINGFVLLYIAEGKGFLKINYHLTFWTNFVLQYIIVTFIIT